MSQLLDDIGRWAKERPAAIAYSSGECCVSYSELVERVDEVAAQLVQVGIGAGSILAFQIPSGPEFIATLLAGLKLRAIVAPIATASKRAELSHILGTISPSFFLCADTTSTSRQSLSTRVTAAGSVAYLESSPVQELPGLGRVYSFDNHVDERVQALCPNGGCIRYTSGTTGDAKGVLISLESAYQRVCAAEPFFSLAPEERVATLLAMPYHFIVSLLTFLRSGATIVRPKNTAPSELVRCFEEEEFSVLYAAPFHFDLFVGAARKRGERLRLAISTSTTLRQETALRFNAKFEIPIADSYGIIEVGIPVSLAANKHAAWGCIGTTLPGYSAAVATDRGFSASGRGTLLLKGPGMFDAYLEPFTTREEILRDGWFETGDLAEIDEQGRIRIYGRKNSAIHIAGFKVFPEEIEAALLEHAAVADAQVLGVQHPTYGNTIHAKIVVTKTARLLQNEIDIDELSAHCRKKLGTLKTPHSFEFTPHLERTSTGKLKRR